jgi:preprotein translocase subunit Sec63
MRRNDDQFMERASRDLKARSMACKVLGVTETAGEEELKKAYRLAAMKFHPDKNLNDPDAVKKFTLVKCAYELLAEDKECPELLKEIDSWSGVPEDEKYKLDNTWGHFLWWREKFFG